MTKVNLPVLPACSLSEQTSHFKECISLLPTLVTLTSVFLYCPGYYHYVRYAVDIFYAGNQRVIIHVAMRFSAPFNT